MKLVVDLSTCWAVKLMWINQTQHKVNKPESFFNTLSLKKILILLNVSFNLTY